MLSVLIIARYGLYLDAWISSSVKTGLSVLIIARYGLYPPIAMPILNAWFSFQSSL